MFVPSIRRLAKHAAPKPSSRRLSVEHLEARDVPSSVQGTVFDDQNGSGTLDAGELGLAGWTVFIDNDRDGVNNPGSASAQMFANGTYQIITDGVAPFVSTSNPPAPLADYHFAALDLQTGTGGRWVNTTRTIAAAAPLLTEPVATRNFGVRFVTDAEAGFAPVGAEQLVNVGTGGQQGNGNTVGELASVSADAVGNYVIAWRTGVPGGTDTISARIFNVDGTPRTGDLLVASEASSSSIYGVPMPRVAMANNGQFSVAWDAFNTSTGNGTTKVRTYTSQGVPITAAITVAASSTTVRNDMDGIAADANGNFVVLYSQTTKSKNWG